mgnify:CR=1 FL=1
MRYLNNKEEGKMSEILGVISAVLLMVLLFKPMFGTFGDFWECLKFWLTPDLISLCRGREEYWADHWAEFKLAVWIFCSVVPGYGVYYGIEKYF